jgi:hypothetical protein
MCVRVCGAALLPLDLYWRPPRVALHYSIALGARVLGGTRGTRRIRIHGDHGLNFWSYFLRFGVSTHNAVSCVMGQ